MKKIAILVASVLVLGGFGTRTFAAGTTTETTQTTQTTEAVVTYKEDAGITPDSLLYTIDKAVDELRVMLATSDEKKAEVIADIAQERLGESEVMTEQGKIELAKKALEEYNAKITEAAQKLQAVIANLDAAAKENTEAAVEKTAEKVADQIADGASEEVVEQATDKVVEESKDNKLEQSIADLTKVIQEVQDKSLAVLDTLKDVVPKESAEDVKEVIEEQTNHKELVANFVKERHEFNAAKKSLVMARVSLMKVEKSGSEEAVKAAQEKLASAQTDYMTAQTELHAAFQAKMSGEIDKAVNKEAAKLKDAVQAPATTTTEQNNQAVDAAVAADATATTQESKTTAKEAKTAEYTKTNNGNGNGNKSAKVEKEDDKKDKDEKNDKEKSAPGKSGEEHGKAGQANGKRK